MTFRFVHAADLHLDSPLRSLALRNPALADLVGNATRRAFIAIVRLCLDEQVDALLLSGDLYDGDQTSMKTARFLANQIDALHRAGIKVFIIRGNHDALSKITKELAYPDSVTTFGARASAVTIGHGDRPVIIHGISFAQSHAPESLLAKFKPPVEGAVNIGLLHTSLGGAAGHDPYAPCDVGDLQRAGFRYWALGHVHGRSVLAGDATVVMPGMPQGRDIGEAGAKSATLVTVADDGAITLEARHTSVAQFERVSVDLNGVEDWRGLTAALGTALGRARDGVASEHLVARLRLTGETPLAWRLRRDMDLLRTEAERQAEITGRTWIDKVEIDCRPPQTTPAPFAADPLDELRRLMGDIADDAAYRAEIADIAEDLRAQLPPECRSIVGTDPADFTAILASATGDGIDEILARLKTEAS
ncbi:MAG: metallophosphoesterase family protein [Janthinobacterium lividum]